MKPAGYLQTPSGCQDRNTTIICLGTQAVGGGGGEGGEGEGREGGEDGERGGGGREGRRRED